MPSKLEPNLLPQIDTSNITNAFVSGMKEDLNLYGNQYNYIILSWTVGYIIGQWVCAALRKAGGMLTPLIQPSNFILTRVRAHSKQPPHQPLRSKTA